MSDFGLNDIGLKSEATPEAEKKFERMSEKDLLAAIKPRVAGSLIVDIEASDKAAIALGFVSREA